MIDGVRPTERLDRLAASQADDPIVPFASNRDRHADLGEDEIGLEGPVSFSILSTFTGLPAVLDTPGFDGGGPEACSVEIARALTGRVRHTPRGALRPEPPYVAQVAAGIQR